MNEDKINPNNPNNAENTPENQPEIVVNNYGETLDSAVVVEEADRTVLLTDKETIVIPKETMIDVVPKNRPRKVYGGMWGQTEIATVGVGMLAILATILLFVFLVIPAKKELEKNRAERDRLEKDMITARSRYGSITSTEGQVAKLITSVTDFETRFLPIASNGRTALYQRLNGLIGAYGLVNTSGPDYAPLEINDQNSNKESDEASGRAKFQSIFPGVYATMTVEGSYQNLRRFIREVETSNQFVVISAVELEPSDSNDKQNKQNQTNQTNAPQKVNIDLSNPNAVNNPPGIPNGQVFTQPPSQNAEPKIVRGKTSGETVSLRLEMAAYFRRPNFVPLAPESDPTAQ
jgi:hypothetical protein